MLHKIRIKNFKSIVDMEMDLGRVNVVIGANGCGKTNILEALAFASAAIQQKLDNEYLLSRGIRVPGPLFLKPAFEDVESPDSIDFLVYDDEIQRSLEVVYDEENKKWKEVLSAEAQKILNAFLHYLIAHEHPQKAEWSLEEMPDGILKEELKNNLQSLSQKSALKDVMDALRRDEANTGALSSYLIFSPQENILRDQNIDSPIQPIGLHGEGLFQFLKEQWKKENVVLYEKLNEGLTMLDWFDSFGLPDDLLSNEAKLKISDRYLKDSLHSFDQRSTNEGFLFLLFYLTLFHSKDTPSFFAIDNIESSFNPKLCMHLVKELIRVAKENDKQVVMTTHNPFVLDALNLQDDEQRLFVARRDIDGHTRISRVNYKPERSEKLSSVWMNGYIGGLPDNF